MTRRVTVKKVEEKWGVFTGIEDEESNQLVAISEGLVNKKILSVRLSDSELELETEDRFRFFFIVSDNGILNLMVVYPDNPN